MLHCTTRFIKNCGLLINDLHNIRELDSHEV